MAKEWKDKYINHIINDYCDNKCLMGKNNCLKFACPLYEIQAIVKPDADDEEYSGFEYDDIGQYEDWVEETDDYYNECTCEEGVDKLCDSCLDELGFLEHEEGEDD